MKRNHVLMMFNPEFYTLFKKQKTILVSSIFQNRLICEYYVTHSDPTQVIINKGVERKVKWGEYFRDL